MVWPWEEFHYRREMGERLSTLNEMAYLAAAGISISPVFSSMFTSFVISTAGRPGHLLRNDIQRLQILSEVWNSHPEYPRNRKTVNLRPSIF